MFYSSICCARFSKGTVQELADGSTLMNEATMPGILDEQQREDDTIRARKSGFGLGRELREVADDFLAVEAVGFVEGRLAGGVEVGRVTGPGGHVFLE
jgi:hypothetical protein